MRAFLLSVNACAALAMQLKITGSGVSEAVKSYADLKLGKPLTRYADLLREDDESVELHLKVESRGRHDSDHLGLESHVAEITAFCKDRHVIHCSAESEDMYASLDDLEGTLGRNLRKYKERRSAVKTARKRGSKYEQPMYEDDEDDDRARCAASQPFFFLLRA